MRATGETRPLVRRLRPDAVVADILTLAPALAGELEGVPVATVIPHTDPRMAPRLAALLGGRAPAAHGGRPAPVGRDVAVDRRRPGARAPRAQRDAPAPGAAGRWIACTAGSRRRWRWWRPSRRSSTRARSRCPRRTSWARCCGSRRRPTSSCRRATTRSCWWRLRPRRTRRTELLRATLRGLADAPVRVLAVWNRRPLGEPVDVPAERAPGRLALLRADDATVRRRRLPRRPRHPRARAGQRLRRGRRPRRGRHERERRAGRLGGRRRARAAAAVRAGPGAPGGGARAGRARRCASAPASSRRGRASTIRRRARPSSSSSSRRELRRQRVGVRYVALDGSRRHMRRSGARGRRPGCARRRACSCGPRPPAGQALPACAPERTLGVKLTSEERELPAPLIATPRRQRRGGVHGHHRARDLRAAAGREGARHRAVGRRLHRPDRRRASRSPCPGSRPSIRRTPRATPSDPLTSCAASTVVTLPIVPARPSRAVKLQSWTVGLAAGLLVVRRGARAQAARPLAAGDLGPHDLTRGLPAGDGRRADDGRTDAHRRPGQVRQEAARPLPPRRGRALPATTC